MTADDQARLDRLDMLRQGVREQEVLRAKLHPDRPLAKVLEFKPRST